MHQPNALGGWKTICIKHCPISQLLEYISLGFKSTVLRLYCRFLVAVKQWLWRRARRAPSHSTTRWSA